MNSRHAEEVIRVLERKLGVGKKCKSTSERGFGIVEGPFGGVG